MIGGWIDLFGLALVLGGSLATATLQAGWLGLATMGPALAASWRGQVADDADEAARLADVAEKLVRQQGRWASEQLHPPSPAMTALLRASEQADHAADFAHARARILDQQRARSDAALRWWRALADAAPVFGMVGTVIGMVQLFANGQGQTEGLATALLTTLYGLLLAGLFASPVAGRLEAQASGEAHWQEMLAGRLADIVAARSTGG